MSHIKGKLNLNHMESIAAVHIRIWMLLIEEEDGRYNELTTIGFYTFEVLQETCACEELHCGEQTF